MGDFTEAVEFVTFGMLIIDDIEFGQESGKPPVTNALGGAGPYAVLGARLITPPAKTKSIAWVADRGYDFPDSIGRTIDRWGTRCLYRDDPSRETTKSMNTYGPNEFRAFRYTTPKKRIGAHDLPSGFVRSNAFHAICSASRLVEIVTTLKQRRQAEFPHMNLEHPVIVWEPVPDLCTHNVVQDILEAAKLVDVISPNDAELRALFGAVGGADELLEERLADKIVASGIGEQNQGFVVVRCGDKGCFYVNRADGKHWFPAYHHVGSTQVQDPTGGGNAFLGAMTVALGRGESVHEACILASVAASFAIEQIGMPKLTAGPDDQDLWNGEDVSNRLQKFKEIMRQGRG